MVIVAVGNSVRVKNEVLYPGEEVKGLPSADITKLIKIGVLEEVGDKKKEDTKKGK